MEDYVIYRKLIDESRNLHSCIDKAARQYGRVLPVGAYGGFHLVQDARLERMHRVLRRLEARTARRIKSMQNDYKIRWINVLREMPDWQWAEVDFQTVRTVVKMVGLVRDNAVQEP